MGSKSPSISISPFPTRTTFDEIDNKELLPSGYYLLYCQSVLLVLSHHSDQSSVHHLCTRSNSPTTSRPSINITTSTSTSIVSKSVLVYNLSIGSPLLTQCLPLGVNSWAVCCNPKYVNPHSTSTHNTQINHTFVGIQADCLCTCRILL